MSLQRLLLGIIPAASTKFCCSPGFNGYKVIQFGKTPYGRISSGSFSIKWKATEAWIRHELYELCSGSSEIAHELGITEVILKYKLEALRIRGYNIDIQELERYSYVFQEARWKHIHIMMSFFFFFPRKIFTFYIVRCRRRSKLSWNGRGIMSQRADIFWRQAHNQTQNIMRPPLLPWLKNDGNVGESRHQKRATPKGIAPGKTPNGARVAPQRCSILRNG